MTKSKKIIYFLSVLLLIILASFSLGIFIKSPNDVSAQSEVLQNPIANTDIVYQNIKIVAYYEELNSGFGGIFAEGTSGGTLGETTTSCEKKSITIDTNSQNVFYAKANTGFYLEGVYSNQDFTGNELDVSLNDEVYSITYNNETASLFYAKFCRKKITITLENGADFSLSGDGTYLYGATVQLDCVENSKNYKFSRWVKVVGDDLTTIATQASYRISATENLRIRAISKLLVNSQKCINGEIEIKTNNIITNERYFEKGTSINISAVANIGYKFVGFSSLFANYSSTFVYIVDIPVSFNAIFESKKVQVVISTNNSKMSSLEGSTPTDDSLFVIGDVISINLTVDSHYALSSWYTNASGSFNRECLNQTYTLTPQDVEQTEIYFNAIVVKELANCIFSVNGRGLLFVDDTYTNDILIQEKSLSTNCSIVVQSSKQHILSKLEYKDLQNNIIEDWLDKIVDGKLSFEVTEDFELLATFSPITWSEIKIEPKGQGTKSNPYLISCPEELAFMEYGINYNIKSRDKDSVDYAKAYYKLTNNINLDGRYWILIGANSGAKFQGVLDLNYKFITNITLVDDSYSSNIQYLFTADNLKIVKIVHDADKTWKVLGITSSVFFAIALSCVLVAYFTNNKTKVKKVVVLDQQASSKK